MKKIFRSFAPAKINLHLEVGSRRDDGFHNLRSLIQMVDWGDRLTVEEGRPGGPTSIEGLQTILPPGEFSLVHRALKAFREETGYDRGLRIIVEKKIPPAAGLGGGSSDAVSLLRVLERLAGECLSLKQRERLALSLGCDLPFFYQNSATALVSGRGEVCESLRGRPLFFVLVFPSFRMPTERAFSLLKREVSLSHHWRISLEELAKSFATERPKSWPFFNSFLPVVKQQCEEGDEIASLLCSERAGFFGLSGSGSTFFGVLEKEKNQKETIEKLSATGMVCQSARALLRPPSVEEING